MASPTGLVLVTGSEAQETTGTENPNPVWLIESAGSPTFAIDAVTGGTL